MKDIEGLAEKLAQLLADRSFDGSMVDKIAIESFLKAELPAVMAALHRAGQEAMRARAAAEAKNPNREGREWVNGSLWDAIAREQSRAIAALPLEEMP